MIPSPHAQAEAETRAALDGLTEILDGPPLALDASLVALRVYGDALRLRLHAPTKVRRWADALGPALLDDVLRAGLALVDLAGISPQATSGATRDPVLGTVIRDRDHAESILHAIRRVWLPRPMSQLSAYAGLVERADAMDRALARWLTRTDVEEMLGQRVAFGAAWSQAFRDDAEQRAVATLRPAPSSMPPSPTVVARYIEGGLLHRLVERIAAANPSFSEELEGAIEAMRAAGQAGFLARAWQQKHATATSASDAFRFAAPPLAHAAASGGEDGASVAHRLGRLFADVDVDATLIVGGREIRLELDFERGSLERISFGDEERAPAEDQTSCCIVVPRTGPTVRLAVVTSSGKNVSETLSLGVSEP